MRLAVNIDHIATIREARKSDEPDPVAAAVLCELAGAQGITVHLRGDRRHIQDRDVELLRKTVTTHLNIEMAATTEGGLDVVLHSGNVEKVVRQIVDARIAVSIFIDPDLEAIRHCHKIGAS